MLPKGMSSNPNSRDREQESDGQSTDYLADHTGARAKAVGSTPAATTVEIAPERDRADLAVTGHYLDGEPSVVQVRLHGPAGADVHLALPPEDAREFAEQVAEAARFAAEGE